MKLDNQAKVDIEKMFDLHLKQMKIEKVNLPLPEYAARKKEYYNAISQMLVLMQEVGNAFPPEKINTLFNDMIVQCDVFFQKQGYAKAEKE